MNPLEHKQVIFLLVLTVTKFSATDNIVCTFGQLKVDKVNIDGYGCYITSIKPGSSKNSFSGTQLPGESYDLVKILYRWELSSVSLSKFDSSTCDSFQYLDEIFISLVKIGRLEDHALENCKTLKKLTILSANIREIPAHFISSQVQLTKIDLRSNQLTSIPESIKEQHHLEELNLENNQLSTFPDSLTTLRILDLSGNSLSNLQPSWFRNLQNLEKLWLNKNDITELPYNVFTQLTQLKFLSLGQNKLTAITSDSFGVHKNLASILLFFNKISSIDENFIDNTALSAIDMRGNVCTKEDIKGTKNSIKSKLQNCFANYNPGHLGPSGVQTTPAIVRTTAAPIRTTTTTRRVVTTQPKTSTQLVCYPGSSDPSCPRPTVGTRAPERVGPNSCGKSSKKGQGNIIGGSFVDRGDYPWIAALIYSSSGNFFCGGTLIGAQKVLTAGHCIHQKYTSKPTLERDIKVSLGVHDLNEKYSLGQKTVGVRRAHVHDQWNPSDTSYDADIAVLVLTHKVTFDEFIQPVCLMNPQSALASINKGIVVGYGQSEDETKLHENIPKKLEMPIQTNTDCFIDFPGLLSLASKRTFCAGNATGTGVCKGDSGSGFLINEGSTFYLRGIVSSSQFTSLRKCDVNSYSIFTDVLKYSNWIHQIDVDEGFFGS